ncbi:MAG TPA: hypothetical protein VGM63_09395 [Mucilaginibacter sp.]|jgi:hypothetical protein
MKTKISLSILLLLAICAGCTPGTKIVNSWRDPDVVVNSSQINKFVVAALLKNQTVRRQVEDQMASLIPGKAVQSYKELGLGELKGNDTTYNKKLKEKGFDGIVVMSLVNVKNVTRYVPGSAPVYYSGWGRYYRVAWTGFYDPGYYTTDKTYDVEVNVYSLKSNKLIWNGNTSEVNPGGKVELFNNISKAVYKKMKNEGFLK